MSKLEIQLIPCLSDNYAYLIRDEGTGTTGVVDPSEAGPVLEALQQSEWHLDYILNTHHHWDHTGGNLEIKKATGCQIVGAKADRGRIPGIDIAVAEGDSFSLGSAEAKVLEISGHTIGHICFWFPDSEALFCGDTLFSIGCGRVFEGTFEQMWQSLDKLRDLPSETRVYCGHEYTVKNAQFALTIDPDNRALQQRLQTAEQLRAHRKPTIPSTLAEERQINPFLRPDSSSIRKNLQMSDASTVDVFAAIRERKDRF